MKMVILGAKAPSCGKKPNNPTSASVVGTMVGQSASQKVQATRSRGATFHGAHRHAYQGLLQAPRLSEIFDHQMIKDNIDASADADKAPYPRLPDGREGGTTRSMVYTSNELVKHTSNLRRDELHKALAATSMGNGPARLPTESKLSHAKSVPKYHYQKFLDEGTKSLGALPPGLRPGQKSIKQQRDLAQLRFYQTLTNQPYLTSQQQPGKSTRAAGPQQVQMLHQMQTGSKGMKYQSNAGPIKPVTPQPPLAAKNGTVSDALRSLEGAWATQ